jgi:CheY-like chemotaxis protein
VAETAAVTVLIVDDEDDMRMLVRAVLQGAGLEIVDEAADGHAALNSLNHLDPPNVPKVMVLDNRMPNLTGLEVAERVLADTPEQRIVLFSAFLDKDVEREAQEIGVRACVAKADVALLPQIVLDLAAS